MRRAIRITVKVFLILVILALLALDLCIILSRVLGKPMMPVLFGKSYAVVSSGSMEPVLSRGDIVTIEKADTYGQNDIITFYDPIEGEYVTHRVIAVFDNGALVTRGDANPVQDSFTLTDELIVGRVTAVTESLGKPILFVSSPLGIFCTLTCVIIIWTAVNIAAREEYE